MTIAVGIVFHHRASRPPVASHGDLEVLVHTNASVAGRPTPWLGFADNHRRLMEEAAGAHWYLALSPDVTASVEDLLRLVSAGEAAGLDVVAPLLRTPWGIGGGPHNHMPGPRQWLWETVRTQESAPAGPRSSGVSASAWVSGACIALRLGCREARFDPRYFFYFEDASLCHRVARAGGRVGVCEDVVVDHPSGWSTEDPLRWRRGVEFARSAMRFAEETGRSPAAMRAAGIVRWGSRGLLPARQDSERAAARVIPRGFVRVGRAPGLRELAAEFNATRFA